ncbi:hypothetical protein C2G38_2233037 [Gigaspora rosea]|uniref:Uncharacterized protein n=1 Tax=Gigaspora rosea TaxID=44941 RepID=A0A397TWK0_9GLOM|nr:hypothetical protein C2G38_2233037 [Gigaspora rosea]
MPFCPSAARAKNVRVIPDVHGNSENVDLNNDDENQEKNTTNDESEGSEPESSDEDYSDENIEESDDNAEESISELFSRVFVNDSLTCALNIEKPYYSAGIYPNVCIKCGSLEVSKPAKGEYLSCSDCGGISGNSGNSGSKKYPRRNKGSKNKRKRVKTNLNPTTD